MVEWEGADNVTKETRLNCLRGNRSITVCGNMYGTKISPSFDRYLRGINASALNMLRDAPSRVHNIQRSPLAKRSEMYIGIPRRITNSYPRQRRYSYREAALVETETFIYDQYPHTQVMGRQTYHLASAGPRKLNQSGS